MMCAISIFFLFSRLPVAESGQPFLKQDMLGKVTLIVSQSFNQIQPGDCPGTFGFVPPRGRRPPLLRRPRSALRHGQVGLHLPLLRLPVAA